MQFLVPFPISDFDYGKFGFFSQIQNQLQQRRYWTSSPVRQQGAELREKLLKTIEIKPGEDSGLRLGKWASVRQQGAELRKKLLKPGEDSGLCLGKRASVRQQGQNLKKTLDSVWVSGHQIDSREAERREKLLKAIGLKPGDGCQFHLGEWASDIQHGGRVEGEAIKSYRAKTWRR